MNPNINQNHEKFTPARFESIDFVMFSIFYVLLGALLPIILFSGFDIAHTEALSVVGCVIWLFLLARLARSRRPLLSFIITLVIIFLATDSFVLCGLISLFAGTVIIPAFLLAKADSIQRALLVFLGCAAVCALGAIYPGGIYPPSLALCSFIPAIFLSFAIKGKLSRVRSICRAGIGFSLSILLLFSVWIARNSVSDIIPFLQGAIDNTRAQLISLYTDAVMKVLPATGVPVYPLDAQELATSAVNSFFNLLPAFTIIMICVVSYALHSILLNVFASYEEDRLALRHMASFDMSLASAIVFLISLLVAAIFSGGAENAYSLTALNITLALSVGLALNAFLALRQLLLAKNPSCSGFLFYAVIVLLFVNYTTYAVLISSVAGAVMIIINTIRIHSRKKKR